jgi:uncharacterized protein
MLLGMLIPFIVLPMIIAMTAGRRCRRIGLITAPLLIHKRRLLQPQMTVTGIWGNHRCSSSSFSHATEARWVRFRRSTQFRLYSTTSSESGPERNEESPSDTFFKVIASLDTPPVYDVDDDTVRERTYQWLRRVVIGLNLCPFAREPTQAKQLRIVVLRGNDEEEILNTLQLEIETLVESTKATASNGSNHTATTITTTLIVCPECYPDDFEEYLNIANALEDAIADHPELVGVVQLASFHPLYCFAGSPDPTEPDNCTNQSPYPIFHLLREMDVTQAVEQLPDQNAAVVWSRNVDLLRALKDSLPAAEFQATVSGTQRTSSQVRTLLRRFPIPLLRGSDGTRVETKDS